MAQESEMSQTSIPAQRSARLSKKDRKLKKKGRDGASDPCDLDEKRSNVAVDISNVAASNDGIRKKQHKRTKRAKAFQDGVGPASSNNSPVVAPVATTQASSVEPLTKAQRRAAAKKRKREAMKAGKEAASEVPVKKKAKRTGDAQQLAFSEEVLWYITDLEDTASRGSLSDRMNPKHTCFDKQLQQQWKTFSKKERAAITASDAKRKEKKDSKIVHIDHPYETNPDDHCETGADAYWHIQPMLNHVAELVGKDATSLRIYDPYYCAGAVRGHLRELGYKNVYNKCEDFYAVMEEGRIPPHDVVVTNPPYSGDHVERLLKWCRSNGKPFLLLMPSYFCRKPYYEEALGGTIAATSVLYLFPWKRYKYWTPKGLRSKDSVQKQHSGADGNRTSPFVSFWYVDLAPLVTERELRRWWSQQANTKENFEGNVSLYKLKDLPPTAFR